MLSTFNFQLSTNLIVAVCIAAITALAGCDNGQDKVAEQWLVKAQALYAEKQYEEALAVIDSLRSQCPEAVEARKQALSLWQEIELAHAERDIEAIDHQLAAATAQYETMKAEADCCHAAGTATASQLEAVTRQRLLCDSLRGAFDVQCAKVKYIRRKQSKP